VICRWSLSLGPFSLPSAFGSCTASSHGVSRSDHRSGPWLTAAGAFVGMFTIIVTLPLPSLLTKKNAEFQQKRMLAVSSGDWSN
jgi:hypothetical protein